MTIKFLTCCFLVLALNIHPASAGTVLITRAEAALPPASAAAKTSLVTRGITRPPTVILLSPVASVTSPFNLRLRFRAHGGSKIQPYSFKAIYLKNPNVDLTSRVMPYVTANGVNMMGAEAPPGHHEIMFKIDDSENREASVKVILNVIK